jgi:hypothetical protein
VAAQLVLVGVVAADEGGNVVRALPLAAATVALLYVLAKHALGPRLAVVAAGLWLSAPWTTLHLFDARLHGALRSEVAPAALGLSDWRAPGWALALLALAVLTLRRPRLGGVAFAAVLGLALVDGAEAGHAFGRLAEQYRGLQEYFWTAPLFLWIPVAGAFATARRSPLAAGLVGLWALAFLLVAGTAERLALADVSLLLALVPAYPALVVLAAALPFLVPRLR